MTEPLKVLFWGHADEGPCAYFRGYMFDEPWKELGIEAKHVTHLQVSIEPEYMAIPEHLRLMPDHYCEECHKRQLEAWLVGAASIDASPVDWADVVVFRRYYNTTYRCSRGQDAGYETKCDYVTNNATEARRHELATGHKFKGADDVTRLMWETMRGIKDKAIVYETDDNHYAIKPWNGYYPDVLREQDLITQMVRRADVVTVSTPTIADYYRRFNPRTRVIRNAIQPDIYTPTKKPYTPKGMAGRSRVLYYGSDVRIRDYQGEYVFRDHKWLGGGAKSAVDSMRDKVYTQFVGYDGHPVVKREFDRVIPTVKGIELFGHTLANTYPEIGLAPLAGDDFDQNKSELHALEYSMVGAATIGQRFMHSGPYQDTFTDGVNILLAKGHQEWIDGLKKLVRNPGLREDIAGAAKEFTLANYDYRKRATEWAEAFRWAHANQGIGLDEFRPDRGQLATTKEAITMGLSG